MSQGLPIEQRNKLLNQLTKLGSGQAQAEREELFSKWFYPVPEHARAFDPDVVLIVGERGTGAAIRSGVARRRNTFLFGYR